MIQRRDHSNSNLVSKLNEKYSDALGVAKARMEKIGAVRATKALEGEILRIKANDTRRSKEIEGAQDYVKKKVSGKGKRQNDLVLVPKSSKERGKLLVELEKRMLKHAEDLEFEEAARVRDQLQQLRDQELLA